MITAIACWLLLISARDIGKGFVIPAGWQIFAGVWLLLHA